VIIVLNPWVLERLLPVEVASIEVVPVTADLDPLGPVLPVKGMLAELVVMTSSEELGGRGIETIGELEGGLDAGGATTWAAWYIMVT
jgi:hypothetical protein